MTHRDIEFSGACWLAPKTRKGRHARCRTTCQLRGKRSLRVAKALTLQPSTDPHCTCTSSHVSGSEQLQATDFEARLVETDEAGAQ